jgi:mono/diheme cytochrome c family protein
LKASIDRGKTIYLKRCLVCHQVDGGGVPHLNAPLDGASQVTGNDKARIIKIVLNGMTEKVELDGEIYSNNMLPQKDLSDQEIADVLTYARNSWTNKASAVTVAEVKVVRAKIK